MSMGPYVRRGASLTWEEKGIKYVQEILELLDTVWVAVIHCRGHQKGDATIAWGNQRGQASSPHEGIDPNCSDCCPVPMFLT
jgi:hypothetical protein